MKRDDRLSLNFFPLQNQDFQFKVYRKPYGSERSENGFKDCYRQRLPEKEGDTDYKDYWVALSSKAGFEAFTCQSKTNYYLTRNVLYARLEKKCSTLDSSTYFTDNGYRKRINFVLKPHPLGRETVWLEPYFLKATNQFGFLADFRFCKAPEAKFDRKVLQLSLSLDKNFRDNRNFYVDRFEKLQQFIREVCPKIFPFDLDEGVQIQITTHLANLPAPHLDVKTYVFAGERVANSQFKGVISYGPLRPVADDTLLFFMYRPQDKSFSHDLYRALRGDTYPTFPGMEKMFGYTLDKDHVGGVPLDGLDRENLGKAVTRIREVAGERLVVPIIIVPWSRDHRGSETGDRYYMLKHLFLKQNIPTQVINLPTLQNKHTLKWAISDIALGVFSKMGGYPWKVQPRNEKCLIIGIGQAHRSNEQGQIEKYFAYSVLTDSSGLYEDLKILGRSDNEGTYLHHLRSNLGQVLSEYGSRFNKFAIHTPFSLRLKEMDAIQGAIDTYAKEVPSDMEFVVLKFNHDNKFFGYALESNSLVPYESSYVQLSHSEFVVWFEGLQYHNPVVRKKVGRPVHIDFVYPRGDLSEDQKKSYLQDAVNLSGANWRGFNAKSLPVSMYYAQLIARYFKEFDRLGLEEIELDQLTPWFL